eukprot:SM000154S01433  [mRNA]  locus=s154:198833:200018:- [translate_table: standard]
MAAIPLCFQCGVVDSPCGCKVMLIVGIICWPLGLIIWCCNRLRGSAIMRKPVYEVYPMRAQDKVDVVRVGSLHVFACC